MVILENTTYLNYLPRILSIILHVVAVYLFLSLSENILLTHFSVHGHLSHFQFYAKDILVCYAFWDYIQEQNCCAREFPDIKLCSIISNYLPQKLNLCRTSHQHYNSSSYFTSSPLYQYTSPSMDRCIIRMHSLFNNITFKN